jgi:hypothetical protein
MKKNSQLCRLFISPCIVTIINCIYDMRGETNAKFWLETPTGNHLKFIGVHCKKILKLMLKKWVLNMFTEFKMRYGNYPVAGFCDNRNGPSDRQFPLPV